MNPGEPSSSNLAATFEQEWVHIPTPGDHYSPRTGSAVITVIHQFNRQHLANGGSGRVLVAPGTWDGFTDGVRVEVPFSRTGTPRKWEKFVDGTLGAILRRRLLSGRQYAHAADYLGPKFNGTIFIHNEPSAVEPIAARCPNARVCLWVHNSLFGSYTSLQARRVLRFTHRVVCVSDYIRRNVASVTGEHEKLVTVLNGVDVEQFAPALPRAPRPVPVVLYLGRIVPEKGVDLLIKAASRLRQKEICFKLRIVGSSNFDASARLTAYERSVREDAKALGDFVEFRPFQAREKVVAEYRDADVYVVPSNWDDPCPLTILEGMASGLPVVAARTGGIPELGGEAIRYFERSDASGLAAELGPLLVDRHLRNTFGQVARARSLDFGWFYQYNRLKGALCGPRLC